MLPPNKDKKKVKARIEGKVAAILNERELAINLGAKAGVKEGMKFEVLDPEPVQIVDPDTREPIGVIDKLKIKVKVIELQDRASIARTYETHQVNVGGTGPVFGYLFRSLVPPKWETRVRTLRTEEWAFEPLEEKSSFVKVGDRVRQITEVQEEQEKPD